MNLQPSISPVGVLALHLYVVRVYVRAVIRVRAASLQSKIQSQTTVAPAVAAPVSLNKDLEALRQRLVQAEMERDNAREEATELDLENENIRYETWTHIVGLVVFWLLFMRV